MEPEHEIIESIPQTPGDFEDFVYKILTVVIKRRKTIPLKCMKINSRISAFELQRLDKAKVIIEDNKNREEIKKLIQKFKSSKCFMFDEDNLSMAEKKLEQYYETTKKVNSYLEKRKNSIN